jgi:hypothetical protein
MFPELSKRASPAAWKSPADVLSEAPRVIASGATLADAATLYLAATRPEARGELGARLAAWAEVWPRLPNRPMSEDRVERIMREIELVTACELDLVAANDTLRLGPDPDRVEERAAHREATRSASGLFASRSEAMTAATAELRKELEARMLAAQQHADGAREALVATLRGRGT